MFDQFSKLTGQVKNIKFPILPSHSVWLSVPGRKENELNQIYHFLPFRIKTYADFFYNYFIWNKKILISFIYKNKIL